MSEALFPIFKRLIPSSIYKQIRGALMFRPNDHLFGWGVPLANTKPAGVERIQAFRFPSPGSRRGARIPIRENEDDVYNINYYSRDPRNLPKDEEVFINSSSKPTLLESKTPQLGSPGQKNVAVAQYDPTGLRSSMTATWGSLEKVAIQRAAPDHLPKPEWYNNFEEYQAESEKKGRPFTFGRRTALKHTENYNEVRW